ncbi:MAG: NAD(P)-binding domain-containing protein [Mycobacterium sp.]|nr:NAD(P)-binding domain-containing protein [Mycobacterium sp.]
MAERLDTVVIGAGQCGLAVGRQLARYGHEFMLVDRNARVGSAWRRYSDSLRLVTPAAVSALAGLDLPAPPGSYPNTEVMAAYLERYAQMFALPCRMRTRVRRLTRLADRFVLDLDRSGTTEPGAGTVEADNVVVATGFLHTAHRPAFAAAIGSSIAQLGMTEYRNPAQVTGPVLVVGAGNSGVQIAYDLIGTHEVWLAGPNPGHFLLDLSAPACWHLAHRWLTRDTTIGRRFIATMLHREPPVIKVSERRLRHAGVVRLPWIEGHFGGLPLVAGRTLLPATIIWTTGFRPDFSWIDLPILGADGLPRHWRGVTDVPGLYFVGLPFQYGFTSHFVRGVDRDAEHVVAHLIRRSEARRPAAPKKAGMTAKERIS